MQRSIIRREVFPFEVQVEDTFEKTTIKDIYITELGYVMISIYNEDRKVTVNYICRELKDILPSKIVLK